MLLLLNYSHPITDDQLITLKEIYGTFDEFWEVRDIPCHLDIEQPFAPQVVALADAAGLNRGEWQTEPFLLNLPALSVAAALLLAEIHGRCGYYPPALRLKREGDPPRFVVAEVLSLNQQRENARGRR